VVRGLLSRFSGLVNGPHVAFEISSAREFGSGRGGRTGWDCIDKGPA